jgi:hypothetical protein
LHKFWYVECWGYSLSFNPLSPVITLGNRNEHERGGADRGGRGYIKEGEREKVKWKRERRGSEKEGREGEVRKKKIRENSRAQHSEFFSYQNLVHK